MYLYAPERHFSLSAPFPFFPLSPFHLPVNLVPPFLFLFYFDSFSSILTPPSLLSPSFLFFLLSLSIEEEHIDCLLRPKQELTAMVYLSDKKESVLSRVRFYPPLAPIKHALGFISRFSGAGTWTRDRVHVQFGVKYMRRTNEGGRDDGGQTVSSMRLIRVAHSHLSFFW